MARSPGRATTVRIVPYAVGHSDGAARMLAEAFETSPVNVAALGAHARARNEAFFRLALRTMRGPAHVAFDAGRIVGFVHWVEWPRCQPSIGTQLGSLPSMVSGLGVAASRRVIGWLSAWARHDPREPHVHLGPIGVAPHAQGRGIGARLMDHYCAHVDARGLVGYLETDRSTNVRFYERFGFRVEAERDVIGVRNYFMRRPAAWS